MWNGAGIILIHTVQICLFYLTNFLFDIISNCRVVLRNHKENPYAINLDTSEVAIGNNVPHVLYHFLCLSPSLGTYFFSPKYPMVYFPRRAFSYIIPVQSPKPANVTLTWCYNLAHSPYSNFVNGVNTVLFSHFSSFHNPLQDEVLHLLSWSLSLL